MAAAPQVDHAQLALAVLYVNGLGVPRDYVEAYRWLDVAAAAEDDAATHEADALRGLIELLMTPAQLWEARNLSEAWRPKR